MVLASSNPDALLEEEATKLTFDERILLSVVFALILITALIGNVASVKLAVKRKHRLFYRFCVVSLAFSDLLLAVSTCTYSLSMFSHQWVNWDLGELMCRLIPWAQTTAVLANSFTLSAIAVDRYHGIVKATRYRWEPSMRTSIATTCVIWVIANGASIPMIFEYHIKPMVVIKYDHIQHKVTSMKQADFCAFTSHEAMATYVALVFALMFFPLMLAFLTLYGIIGCYLWRKYSSGRPSAMKRYRQVLAMKRREVAGRPRDASSQGQSESTSAGRSASDPTCPPPLPPHSAPRPEDRSLWLAKRRLDHANRLLKLGGQPMETIPEAENVDEVVPRDPLPPQIPYIEPPPLPPRGLGTMEKHKKRILKIIFALMLTFMLTRLPIWTFNLLHTYTRLDSRFWWLLQYVFSAISLLGTVLNPYLYSFMQEGHAGGDSSCTCNFIKRIRRSGRQPDVELYS